LIERAMTADEPQEQEEQPDLDDAAYDALAPEGMPPIDFNIFVLSLNTSALIHLGEAPGAEGASQVNLPLARQTIDLLGILERKTRGNLTGAEERILHQVLFDLRMRYTQRCK
jgi:hypothetical protein